MGKGEAFNMKYEPEMSLRISNVVSLNKEYNSHLVQNYQNTSKIAEKGSNAFNKVKIRNELPEKLQRFQFDAKSRASYSSTNGSNVSQLTEILTSPHNGYNVQCNVSVLVGDESSNSMGKNDNRAVAAVKPSLLQMRNSPSFRKQMSCADMPCNNSVAPNVTPPTLFRRVPLLSQAKTADLNDLQHHNAFLSPGLLQDKDRPFMSSNMISVPNNVTAETIIDSGKEGPVEVVHYNPPKKTTLLNKARYPIMYSSIKRSVVTHDSQVPSSQTYSSHCEQNSPKEQQIDERQQQLYEYQQQQSSHQPSYGVKKLQQQSQHGQPIFNPGPMPHHRSFPRPLSQFTCFSRNPNRSPPPLEPGIRVPIINGIRNSDLYSSIQSDFNQNMSYPLKLSHVPPLEGKSLGQQTPPKTTDLERDLCGMTYELIPVIVTENHKVSPTSFSSDMNDPLFNQATVLKTFDIKRRIQEKLIRRGISRGSSTPNDSFENERVKVTFKMFL